MTILCLVDLDHQRWVETPVVSVGRVSARPMIRPVIVLRIEAWGMSSVINLDQVLEKLGFSAGGGEWYQDLRYHVVAELESRVGIRIARGLTSDQLLEFEEALATDDRLAQAWLERFCPNHKDIVHEELEAITSELAARRAEILAASGGDQTGPGDDPTETGT